MLEVDPQEYGLFLNETNTAFIQLPDEDFELIEVAGQTALFTENRYVDETVPMGLHCYQLRHSDDGANFISLERRVGVNFGGTVISSTRTCVLRLTKPKATTRRRKSSSAALNPSSVNK